jgi:hypothetical protein
MEYDEYENRDGVCEKPEYTLRNYQQDAVAELAVATFLGWEWKPRITTYDSEPDLDGDINVRSRLPSQPYMRVDPSRDKDAGYCIFVCVTCMNDDLSLLRIDGWEYGSVIMSTELQTNRENNKKQWQYPVHKLRPTSTLQAVADARRAERRP